MATMTYERLRDLRGADVLDRDGERIGKLEEVFLDDASGDPEFLGIGRGFLRMQRALVPVEGLMVEDDHLRVPYEKDTVKDSPDADGDVIDAADERALYEYYGVEATHHHANEPAPTAGTRTTDTDDAAVTRSEEELRVGKRTTDAGHIRLRKWVDTEHVEEDVPVAREEAHVEREAVNRPATRADIGEKEVEVSLEEEHVVTDKEAVAKERVGIEKERRTDHETVSEDLRKERVEVDDDTR